MTLEIELDIPGVSVPVIPEVAYRRKNLFEAQLYAKDNGFGVFDSPEAITIAYFVKPETPDVNWVTQQAEKLKVYADTVEDAYANLHDGIWEKYWIRTGEILAFPRYSKTSPRYSERIVNSELNRNSEKPVLLRGYEVEKRTGDYLIYEVEKRTGDYLIKDGKAIEVDWPRRDGKIPKNLSEILNAKDDTYVWIDPDPKLYEGLRTLDWNFSLHERPYLHLTRPPWHSYDTVGYLLGRISDRAFVKISRARYRELIEFGNKISSLNEEWQRLVSGLHSL